MEQETPTPQPVAPPASEASAQQRARQLLEPVARGEDSSKVVTLLAQALSRDEDLKNAEAQGYLRGRNEHIEALTHPQPPAQTEPACFPRFARVSVWDR